MIRVSPWYDYVLDHVTAYGKNELRAVKDGEDIDRAIQVAMLHQLHCVSEDIGELTEVLRSLNRDSA